MSNYDAIIVGAGHNGLAAAALLARSGRRVAVVERSGEVGGAAAGYDIAPGYRAPRFAHLLHAWHPKVDRQLDLAAQGLTFARRDLPTVALAEDGRHVIVEGTAPRFAGGAAHPQAQAFADLHARLIRFAGVLAGKLLEPPPRLARPDWRDLGGLARLGFDLLPGDHPIIPVMIGDAATAKAMADALLTKGVYVIAFSYPVVPEGLARIRTQMSAAHSREDLEFAVAQFAAVKQEMGL
mgnify:CR=1 FL=1